jgi:hypothetical protein
VSLALYNSGLPDQHDSWERCKGESPQAWAAFQAYRDMRVGERSTRKLAKAIGKSHTLIGHWCAAWDWVGRAAAWDRELERIALQTAAHWVERPAGTSTPTRAV